MSVFFELPEELCEVLLSEWLHYKVLALFDSAVCSNQWRAQLQSCFPVIRGSFCSYSALIIRGSVSSMHALRSLQWINSKGIRLTNLDIEVDMTSPEWMTELSSHWLSLNSLKISCHICETFGDLISCPALTSLTTTEFDFLTWKGESLSNLTELTLAGFYFAPNPIKVMKILHKYCHKLKMIRFGFSLCDEAGVLLLQVIQQNVDLVSVQLKVNASLLQGLATLRWTNLTSLDLSEYLDLNHVVALFKSATRIEKFKYSNYKTCMVYDKRRQFLKADGTFNEAPGWESFATHISDIREIFWSGRKIDGLADGNLLSESLRSLTISTSIEETVLKTILSRCMKLETLYYDGSIYINWASVLNESNVIENLTVDRPYSLLEVFTTCRCLKQLKILSIYVDRDGISSLFSCIKNFRHAITGQPANCDLSVIVESFVDKKFHTLTYNGTTFSGSLTKEYGGWIGWIESLTSGKDEIIAGLLSRVKELEDRAVEK